MTDVALLRTRRIWRSPTWVLARVWLAIGFGAPLVAVAIVLAIASPVDRKVDTIAAIDTPSSLDAELADLFAEREDLIGELDEIADLPATSPDAQAMIDTRTAQIEAAVEEVDERALGATSLAGLRCELEVDAFDRAEAELICEGPELEELGPLGWIALGAVLSLFGIAGLVVALFWERRLIPYSSTRTRLLPPLVVSVGALVAPPVAWSIVFFARTEKHTVPLAGAPDPMGVALGGLLVAVAIAVLIHVCLTAPAPWVLVVVSFPLAAAAAVGALAVVGADVAALAALGAGVVSVAVGLVGSRRVPPLGIVAIVGLELVIWAIGLAAMWAWPGGWSWAVAVAVCVLAAPSLGIVDDRLRRLVPQGLGPPSGVLLS